MRRTLARLAERVAAWWNGLPNHTIAEYTNALGLPRLSNWRLLPYFLLLVVLFVLFPLFLLVARIVIRRAKKRQGQ
jgi:hypothetical protein